MVRSAIRDREALGELLELLRSDIHRTAYRWLAKFRRESWAEDLTQEILVDVIRSFPAFDPTRSHIFAWIKTIIRHDCIDFTNRDLVWLRSDPLPDNTDREGPELQADPLDLMAHAAWESDYLELPAPVHREKKAPRRVGFGRTAKKALEQRRKERELQAKRERQASGKRRRNRRCLPHQRVNAIRRRREEWAEASP